MESSGVFLARRTHIGVSEQACLEGRKIDLIRAQEHAIYFFLGFPSQHVGRAWLFSANYSISFAFVPHSV